MTLRKPVLALMLSFSIAISLIALIQLEKNSSLNFNSTTPLSSNLPPKDQIGLWTYPTFAIQPAFQNAFKETESSLVSNSTRTEVYEFIVANPGIQFRGICTGLSVAIGTAEFHLGVLKKAGLISFFRDGKYKRFFAAKKFSTNDMKLISLLRHKTTRQILKTIAAEKTVSHSKLASNLSITSQGLTWQMNRLKEAQLVQENWVGIKVTYSVNALYTSSLNELLCITEK